MKTDYDPKNDLWAFREGRKSLSGAALFEGLANAIAELCEDPADNRLAISALMRAGEFETGLADANAHAHFTAQKLTDVLARVFLGDAAGLSSVRGILSELSRLGVPASLSVSPPEGFAYYALHPHDFARLAAQVVSENEFTLVIGIRSIGATLSAIVLAALQQSGKTVDRFTVRPSGHPYERVVHFSPDQKTAIEQWNGRGADFVVVDEGPGRSGSSFLSVAEALTHSGIANERITMLGSRQTDVSQLCAQNAPARWSRYRFLWPEPSVYTRFSDHTYIGGGSWREALLGQQATWPACWPQMERLKFLSPDGQFVVKFEGFGHFGEEALARSQLLAKAGFGSPAEHAGDGMISYQRIFGLPLRPSDVSRPLLQQLARYCSFRASEFRCANSAPTQIPAMLEFNALHEFGVEVGLDSDKLCAADAILADAQMQTHEWIRASDGRVLKVDACTHGDDHFFPGPTDIAWDLAGTIVEWNLDPAASDYFLSEFKRISGLDRQAVIREFILAYTIFRMAYWKMALSTVIGSADEESVLRAYRHYRKLAEGELRAMADNKVKVTPLASENLYSGKASLQPGTAA